MRFLFFTIIIFFSSIAQSQCPTADFILQANACSNENLPIENLSSADSLLWDYCSNDFEADPVINAISDLSANTAQPWGYEVVYDNGQWYGFIMSRGLFLIRADFGSSLENTPTIIPLGNPSDLLIQPEHISFIKKNNLWFGVVTQNTFAPNNDVILLEFGNNITNTPTARILGNFGLAGKIRSVKVVNDNQDIILLVADSGKKLTLVNFRDSFQNTILAEHILTTENLAGANFIFAIDALKICDNWHVLTASYSSDAISNIKFGSNLFSLPISESSVIFSEIDRPQGVAMLMQGEVVYVGVSADNVSPLSILAYEDISSSNPPLLISSAQQSLPMLTALDLNYESGGIYLNGIYSGNRLLYQIKYKKDCSVVVESSTNKAPSLIQYNNAGTYNVSLNLFNIDGSTNGITKTITISPSLAPQPSTQITGNCLSSPINFSGQKNSGDITTWSWDFGDGSGTSTLQDASYTYASTGSYQVKLSVTDANGCTNLLIDTVEVYEESVPNFTFSGGTSLCKNNLVTFINSSTGETGDIVNWNWDFNGEGSSSEKEPTFTFLTPGTKNITLTSSIPGCANVIQKTLIIIDAPTTNFEFIASCNGDPTNFTDLTIGDNLTTWNWNFGDGTTSTEQNTSHTYAAPGSYDVTLVVTNNTGCFTSATRTVVNYSNPIAKFKNDLPCSTTPIQFTDQSLVDNANIIGWKWNFGDGTTSTEQHPAHLFGQTGEYIVKLKSYSQFGCVDSTESLITVAQGPEVDFEWDKSCEGEATTFTDLTNSFGNQITNWTWIINGVLHTSQNPTYTFRNAGTYTVQLSVTMNNLCTQTLTEDIIIEEPPIVQFDYFEDCSTSNTSFYDLTDQTNDKIITREWRVDGAIISSDSVATSTLEPGNYEITLSVVTNSGCEEITTSTVSLVGSPTADFNSNTVYGATPLVVNFNNLSSGGTNYEWSFGDANNSTSSEQNPSFIYTEIGIYNVALRTSSAADCYNESVLQLEVVAPITKASLLAITPVVDNDKTNYILTIENSGTTLITNSTNIIFRTDYGAEIVEPINTVIYAGKIINYSPAFAISTNSSTQNLCVELKSSEAIQLDEECIALNSSIVISEPYPNPSKGLFTVDVILESANTIDVQVLNRLGQPVISTLIEGVIGLNELSLDGKTLTQGIYIIEVKVGEVREKYKISITR